MARLFGTDGVRGVANRELDGLLAYKLGKYGARVLRARFKQDGDVIIAHDGRISSDMLTSALAAGFCSEGINVHMAGLLPTPGLSYLVRTNPYALAVMVSASHNSYEYNGIKFFDHDGYKLPDDIEDEIEAYIFGEKVDDYVVEHSNLGKIYQHDLAHNSYLQYLHQAFPLKGNNTKIVIDCANGASSEIANALFSSLGFNIIAELGINNNGLNINLASGSTHPDYLARTVEASGADLGFAFDGDADRIIAVDRNGHIVDGDRILCLLAYHMQKQNKLKNNGFVATIMSNLGLSVFAKKHNMNVPRASVGDRYVLEKMLHDNFNLGGEQSGHIILRDYQNTGDGLLSALAILYALQELNMDLTDINDIITLYPQVMVNVPVKNKDKAKVLEDQKLKFLIHEKEENLDGKGRILIRASGTEPVIRVMVEAETIDDANQLADIFVQYIKKCYTV